VTDYVEVEVDDGVAVWQLNRPPVNAVNNEVLREAEETLSRIEEDDSVRAVVITGTGQCFSAGLDLKEVPHYDRAQQRELIESVNRVIPGIYAFPKPVVAAVNGHAIAGGFVLGVSCDYRVGPRGDFQFGLSEVRMGTPFPIAAIEIPRAELTPRAARMVVLTGRLFDPEEASALGFLDEVVAPERVLPRAMDVARRMAALPPNGFNRIKGQLKGDAIAHIESVIASGDPMLDSWITVEARGGAARTLGRKEEGV